MANNIYSVAQINKYIAGIFKTDTFLPNISVQGEIGTLSYSASGHIYFTLKDEESTIRCAMWKSKRSGLNFQLKTGMKVVVTGGVDVYVQSGSYQITASKIAEVGVGNIYEQFELLKKKLEAEGLFDPQYKRSIPTHIKTLGVVTAATGAAVRDIISISKRRNPGIQIILYPALVQGSEAPADIISGINVLEEYGVDCIIVGRGGGSMEDLWCFNDEGVAQTIFNCSVPVISAVGHETDFTIADFVSDLRAPTPSAAAELAVVDISHWMSALDEYNVRYEKLMKSRISAEKDDLRHYADKIRLLSPESKLNENRNRLVTFEEKLDSEMKAILTKYKNLLSLNAQRLHGVSPLNKLGGGYAYVAVNSTAIRSISDVNTGDEVTITLNDGRINALVTNTEKDNL